MYKLFFQQAARQDKNKIRVKLLKAINAPVSDKTEMLNALLYHTNHSVIEFRIQNWKQQSTSNAVTSHNAVWKFTEEFIFEDFPDNESLTVIILESKRATPIASAKISLLSLPRSWEVKKRVQLEILNTPPDGYEGLSYILLSLNAENFGANATTQNLKSLVSPYHTIEDPLRNLILVKTGDAFSPYCSFEQAINVLIESIEKPKEGEKKAVTPTILVFGGDYMVRKTVDISMRDFVLFGIGEVSFHHFNLRKRETDPIFRFGDPDGSKIDIHMHNINFSRNNISFEILPWCTVHCSGGKGETGQTIKSDDGKLIIEKNFEDPLEADNRDDEDEEDPIEQKAIMMQNLKLEGFI